MVIGSTRGGNFSTFRSTAQKSFANVSPTFTRPRITFCQPGRDGAAAREDGKNSSSRVTSGRDRQSCGSQMIRCVALSSRKNDKTAWLRSSPPAIAESAEEGIAVGGA